MTDFDNGDVLWAEDMNDILARLAALESAQTEGIDVSAFDRIVTAGGSVVVSRETGNVVYRRSE